MTPLPSRLRASAQALRTLDAVSLRPSSLALIDRERATSIASELEEAAQALEANPVAWRVRGYAQFKTGRPGPWRYFDGPDGPAVNTPDCCDVEPLYAAPSAQVTQEGGGVATDQPNREDGNG